MEDTDRGVSWAAYVEPPSLAGPYLQSLLVCLTSINLTYLSLNPRTPKLYASGVVYRREPPHRERWASIPIVLGLGFGDCEDLACWLAAEYVHGGELGCHAVYRGKKTPKGTLYHIVVRRADGSIEDPSKKLGM